MKLIFEQSHPGHRSHFLPASDVPAAALPEELARESALDLPELTESELARHYEALAQQVHGVNKGFYPLGSCTMKYNPRIDEDAAALPGFTGVHPLQSETTSRGCREVLRQAEERLTAITGMDRMTFQPAAGAHGEYMGLLLIKAYHERRGDKARTKVLVPDSA
ncbi:MAG: aminomethyl-transferring glycine dehydrogenase subunit GcvPB, partial [Clostridiales bacterium]|nr:aminomethyl-transferring glycine dehydrogenase subunit GcvPB [Clostridiales bacterium]